MTNNGRATLYLFCQSKMSESLHHSTPIPLVRLLRQEWRHPVEYVGQLRLHHTWRQQILLPQKLLTLRIKFIQELVTIREWNLDYLESTRGISEHRHRIMWSVKYKSRKSINLHFLAVVGLPLSFKITYAALENMSYLFQDFQPINTMHESTHVYIDASTKSTCFFLRVCKFTLCVSSERQTSPNLLTSLDLHSQIVAIFSQLLSSPSQLAIRSTGSKLSTRNKIQWYTLVIQFPRQMNSMKRNEKFTKFHLCRLLLFLLNTPVHVQWQQHHWEGSCKLEETDNLPLILASYSKNAGEKKNFSITCNKRGHNRLHISSKDPYKDSDHWGDILYIHCL